MTQQSHCCPSSFYTLTATLFTSPSLTSGTRAVTKSSCSAVSCLTMWKRHFSRGCKERKRTWNQGQKGAGNHQNNPLMVFHHAPDKTPSTSCQSQVIKQETPSIPFWQGMWQWAGNPGGPSSVPLDAFAQRSGTQACPRHTPPPATDRLSSVSYGPFARVNRTDYSSDTV